MAADKTNGQMPKVTDEKPVTQGIVAVAPVLTLGKPVFSWPQTETVHDARFGKPGSKSTAAVNYAVEIALGVIVKGTIYGRLEPVSDGVKITFEASAPTARNIEFTGKLAKDRLLAHVESAALAWPAFDAATTAAQNRLMGIKAEASAETVIRPDMKPRLVKVTKADSQPATA